MVNPAYHDIALFAYTECRYYMACWWFWAYMVACNKLKGSIYSNVKIQYCQLLLSTVIETYLVQSISVPRQVHLVLLYMLLVGNTLQQSGLQLQLQQGKWYCSALRFPDWTGHALQLRHEVFAPLTCLSCLKWYEVKHFKTILIMRASRDMYVYMKITRHAIYYSSHSILVYQHLQLKPVSNFVSTSMNWGGTSRWRSMGSYFLNQTPWLLFMLFIFDSKPHPSCSQWLGSSVLVYLLTHYLPSGFNGGRRHVLTT